MSTLAFVLAFCVIAAIAFMARYSARLHIEQRRLIAAPIAQVYARIADLQHWSEWAPWLAAENDPHLVFSSTRELERGHCAWNSARSGQGVLEQLRLLPLERVEQRLRCTLPFVLRARITWSFSERAGQTEVSWVLHGRVNFALRFVATTVQTALALDFRYAMERLAATLEAADAPRYSISHSGVHEMAATRYVSSSYQGPIQGLSDARQRALSTLHQELAAHAITPCGAALAVYRQTNTRLRMTQCDFGIPIGDQAAPSFTVRELPAQRVYVLRLRGSHGAMDIAWFLAMQRMLADELLQDQRLPPFERFLVDAGSAAENELLTELHIPVRDYLPGFTVEPPTVRTRPGAVVG